MPIICSMQAGINGSPWPPIEVINMINTPEFKGCWQMNCRHCNVDDNEMEPTCLLPQINTDTCGRCASSEPLREGHVMKGWNDPTMLRLKNRYRR